MARSAAAEDTATNRPAPASIIGGTHTSARCRTPDRFTRNMSSKASSGMAQAASPLITPAAVTTAAGTRPASRSRSVPRTEPSPTSAMSSSTDFAPAVTQSRATAARSSGPGIGYSAGGCGAHASTSSSDQPSPARVLAAAAPIPRAAPVTTASRSVTLASVAPRRPPPSCGLPSSCGLSFQEPVHGGGQGIHQVPEQPLALGRRRARRVSEHAVRANRADSSRTQQGQDLLQRADIATPGRVQAHRFGGQREHDRGFGPAGVCVTPGQRRVPGQAGAALVAEPPDGLLDGGQIPAVPVDQQQRSPVQAGVPAQLDQAGGQRLRADGQGAGEGRVLAAGAHG